MQCSENFRGGGKKIRAIKAGMRIIGLKVADADEWKTSEEGHHFKVDGSTGEIKAGFGGKYNGKKASEAFSGKKASSGFTKKESPKEMPSKKAASKPAEKSAKAKTEKAPKQTAPKKPRASKSELGDLVNTYPNGTKEYQKKGVDLTPQEHKDWMYAMGHWVQAEATRELKKAGYKPGDIDFTFNREKGTCTIKTWKNDPKSRSGMSNQYFDVKLTGTRTTNVRADGTRKVYTMPDNVRLEFRGSEDY